MNLSVHKNTDKKAEKNSDHNENKKKVVTKPLQAFVVLHHRGVETRNLGVLVLSPPFSAANYWFNHGFDLTVADSGK